MTPYTKIFNPFTNRYVNINTNLGKNILQSYMNKRGGSYKSQRLTSPESITKELRYRMNKFPKRGVQVLNFPFTNSWITERDIIYNVPHGSLHFSDPMIESIIDNYVSQKSPHKPVLGGVKIHIYKRSGFNEFGIRLSIISPVTSLTYEIKVDTYLAHSRTYKSAEKRKGIRAFVESMDIVCKSTLKPRSLVGTGYDIRADEIITFDKELVNLTLSEDLEKDYNEWKIILINCLKNLETLFKYVFNQLYYDEPSSTREENQGIVSSNYYII